MKNILWIILIIAVLLTGCSAKNIENKNTPFPNPVLISNIDYQYNKYLIDPYVKKNIDPDEQVYKMVFDAVEHFEPSVDVSKMQLTNEAVDAVGTAIFTRYEFNNLTSILLSQDKKTININYKQGTTKNGSANSVDAFRKKVVNILENVVSKEVSETQNVLAVYNYFAKNKYNESAKDVGAYGIMVNGEGMCTGYAYAIHYILDQMDIENHFAFSSDESHLWNVVKMDEQYYHIDATRESQMRMKTEKNTLNYFGMTDEQKAQDFDSWFGRAISGFTKYDVPKCTDKQFEFLKSSLSAKLEPKENYIEYETDSGEIKKFNLKNK